MASKWDARYSHPVPHTNSYYAKCMFGGSLACGLTHTGVVSLDVVKCNMQTNPSEYKGLVQGLKHLRATEGFKGMTKGWLPTLMGYSAQGLFKMGLNEVFKDFYANLLGEEASVKYRAILWACASGSAEFFADIALCPFEMVKVRVQTDPAFPKQFGAAWGQMSANRADTGFPFRSLAPLWTRQIPYTIAKFVGFEAAVEWFYTNVFTKPKSSYGYGTQLGVTFASGYIAGVFCAIISQPADSIVSQLGKAENKGKGFGDIAKQVGFKNLCTKGLGTRIIMIGTLTGLQWFIYDNYKYFMKLGTSGGGNKPKAGEKK